jgi:nitrite reductase/ring-hydroxylating ferredoxin subunit
MAKNSAIAANSGVKSSTANARFPFTPFPNGWFRVAYSDEIALGQVKPLYYFGRDLVLFRTADGIPHLFDAYCPHLGAHLGYGGSVTGETIRCPFHGWQFNGSGRCTNVPYTNEVPTRAQIPSWPILEIDGLILAYYHAEGKLPSWQVPEFTRWDAKHWTPFHRQAWRIRTHVQEMVENSVDTTHFVALHGAHTCEHVFLQADGHILTNRMLGGYNISLLEKLKIRGDITIDYTFYGLGLYATHSSGLHQICGWVNATLKLNTILIFMLTPIDREYLDVHILYSIRKFSNGALTRAICKQTLADTIKLIEQDIPIMENKLYRSDPLLCEGDGPIMQCRRWSRQFYSEEPQP